MQAGAARAAPRAERGLPNGLGAERGWGLSDRWVWGGWGRSAGGGGIGGGGDGLELYAGSSKNRRKQSKQLGLRGRSRGAAGWLGRKDAEP